jgi:tryptophan halogenase
MLGQGIVPKHYHHIARTLSDSELDRFLNGLRASIQQAVAKLPDHQDFVEQYCKMNIAQNVS